VSTASPAALDAGAFDLGDGRDAALCLHGLTGTPYEIRPIGEALAAAGVRAVGPLLPGHGGEPEVLARTGCEDWIDAVANGHRVLRGRHERVFLVGLSLGGLLSLHHAAHADVDALVVIGVPLRLRTRLAKLLPIARYRWPYLPKRRGSDIRDAAARERHPSLRVMPTASAIELIRLQHRVRASLGRVSAPLLVAHGSLDATAHPDDARQIAAEVASPERELLWLPNSGHVAPVDYDGPELARAVVDFLTRKRHPLRYVAPLSFVAPRGE
jgi:carboxylesterase